jgi:ABC-2 type transport system ATP-binding protein
VSVIEVRGLTKRFGPVLAVDNLSFHADAGTMTGFLGPNGAGKTTTLRMLLGLIQPASGTATINGLAYGDLPSPIRQVGAVLDTARFHPGRTAEGHLRVHATAGQVGSSRVDAVLERTGLAGAARRGIGGFSLGMRQRLGLATALLGDPRVLILDEPANGLDPDGVRWLRDLLQSLAREGRTVLVSSHMLAEVAQIAGSVIILTHGRLIAQAPLAELTTQTRQVVRIRTPRAADLHVALAADGAQVGLTTPDLLEGTGVAPEQAGTIAARLAIPIFECVTQSATLEDVFFRLTAEPGARP